MSETPIYDALMQEYNSRRGHVNPLMEPHMDAKTLRKNIALKQDDEEPEYTRTSTGEDLMPTDSFLAKVEPVDNTLRFGDHEERAARYIVDPEGVKETTGIKIMARELTLYAKNKFASDYPNAAFMGLRDAHRNDDGSITLTVEGLERPSFDAESLTPEYTVKPLSEADLAKEFLEEKPEWRERFIQNLPPSDPELLARKGGISYNLSLLFEDSIHMLDLKKDGCSWQNYVSGVTDKITSENPGCVVRSVDSKMELDGTTTVRFRGDPAPKLDETQAMDFRGYFDKKEAE